MSTFHSSNPKQILIVNNAGIFLYTSVKFPSFKFLIVIDIKFWVKNAVTRYNDAKSKNKEHERRCQGLVIKFYKHYEQKINYIRHLGGDFSKGLNFDERQVHLSRVVPGEPYKQHIIFYNLMILWRSTSSVCAHIGSKILLKTTAMNIDEHTHMKHTKKRYTKIINGHITPLILRE